MNRTKANPANLVPSGAGRRSDLQYQPGQTIALLQAMMMRTTASEKSLLDRHGANSLIDLQKLKKGHPSSSAGTAAQLTDKWPLLIHSIYSLL
jgi:hypothetical protein